MSARRILHTYHQPLPGSLPADDERRNAFAYETWLGTADDAVIRLPFLAPTTKWPRCGRGIGDPRLIPYVKDLFDFACNEASDDIIVWSNLDCCMAPWGYEQIRAALDRGGELASCFSRRHSVASASAGVPPKWKMHFNNGADGVDLVAFRPAWWRHVHREMPDMFLACERFDSCLQFLVLKEGGCELRPRVIYHEEHGASFWHRNANDPANLHNNLLAAEFAQRIGLPVVPSERVRGGFEADWSKPHSFPVTDAVLRFDWELAPYAAGQHSYIETTFGADGRSLKAALESDKFARCVSIERDRDAAGRIMQIFGDGADVRCGGDAAAELRRAIDPARPTTFFLDAHGAGASPQCPLLAELAAIKAANWQTQGGPIILIDDSDCFFPDRWARRRFEADGHRPADWPSAAQIAAALPEGFELIERGTVLVATARNAER